MRHYQCKNNNPYYIDHNVYMQMVYKLKDYSRLIKERSNTMYDIPYSDLELSENEIKNQAKEKTKKLTYINNTLEAIDKSSMWIKNEMKEKVYDDFEPLKAFWSYDYFNYMHKRKCEDDIGPSARTWNYFKSKLAYKTSKELNIF